MHKVYKINCMLDSIPFSPANTKSNYLPDKLHTSMNIRLELDVDLEKQVVRGRCVHLLKILASNTKLIVFDAVDMKILEVTIREKKSQNFVKSVFSLDGMKLVINLDRSFEKDELLEVAIDYMVERSAPGIHFYKPSKIYPDWPYQAWTQAQSDDARCWFPCVDVPSEKSTFEVLVTVDNGYMAISNGILVRKFYDTKQKKTTYYWKLDKPISMYLLSLVVGKFESYTEYYRDIPLIYYFPAGKLEEAKLGFASTKFAMEIFEKEIGVNYPYSHYSQVAAFDFTGGMEHATVTTQTDRILLDKTASLDYDFDKLVAHELAHQWFGDLVTCKDWSHGWLNESFATYYDALFQLYHKGLDEFRLACYNMANTYFEEAKIYKRPIVYRNWRESFQMFDSHLYQKGACILHWIRERIGAQNWQLAIKHYISTNKYKSVETSDLVKAFYDAVGINIEPILDEWVFKPGHLEIKVNFDWNDKEKVAKLHIIQMQAINNSNNVYKFPIKVEFDIGKNSSKMIELQLSQPESLFVIPLQSKPNTLVVDPTSELLLKKVEQNKPLQMWFNQMKHDNPLIRVEAYENLTHYFQKDVFDTLLKQYENEKFWWARSKLVESISKFRNSYALEFLLSRLDEKHPKVRRAVVSALGVFRSKELVPIFKEVFEKDESIFVRSEALKALGHIKDKSVKKILQKAMQISSWDEVIKVAAIEALAEYENNPQIFLKMLEKNPPIQVKSALIIAYSKQTKGDSEITRKILEYYKDPSKRVKLAVLKALELRKDPFIVAELDSLLKVEKDSINRCLLDKLIRVLRHGKYEMLPQAIFIEN